MCVCQGNACRRGGSERVLEALRAIAPSDTTIVASGCLGQCGNGPMVLVLPEEIWYCRVHPTEVLTLVERHLQQGQPVQAMLYRKFHPVNTLA
ncbi:MAG TPA: (2Fe-2S) ferredoxin domain-containing protein [Crinalium sp.]